MKKIVSLWLCLSLVIGPLQALAATNDGEVSDTTEMPLDLENTPDKAEENLDVSNTETESASVEEVLVTPDKMEKFKETLLNRQRIRTLANKKADALLVKDEMLTLTGLIEEMIYELAILMELEFEDIEISDEDYQILGREILVAYYQHADYLLATHQNIYTEDSLADLASSVLAARQHLNTNDATFNSMETHFYLLQNQVILLEKIPDFTLDTAALTTLLTEISEAKLNKKEYVLSNYTIFEELHTLAKKMITAIDQGEILPQSEVDKLTEQLQLAYTSLIKKTPETIPSTESLNLTLTNTSGKYPILAEVTTSEITARVYGDNGFFQEDGTSRVALYIAGHPIYEEFIYHDDGLHLSMNQINNLILEAKLEALEEGVTVPDLPLVTRSYQINVNDKRQLPTEVVMIAAKTESLENVGLTGGNFGETYLNYHYDGESEIISLDYYLNAPTEDEEPLESTELSLDEPLLVTVQKDGKEQLIRLVFEKEIKESKPKPPIKEPDAKKDKDKDKNKDTDNKQKNQNKDKQNTSKPQGKNLPKTNEQTEDQFALQLLGTFLMTLAVYKRFREKNSLTKLDN